MKDAIVQTVLNKISDTSRRGVPKPSTLKLFRRVPILHEFERHLKIIENEFTILKAQLVERSFHVSEHESTRIGDVASEVENIVDSYAYFLVQADDLSESEQNNTANELKNRIIRVPSICLRNPQHAQDEQLIQRGLETQQNCRLTEWLMDPTTGRTIISVWGTRSKSKTKLVKKVCENPEIKNNFHSYAYITVSECGGIQQLLRKVADQLTEGGERIEDDHLETAMQGFLQNKRYLIILDDFKDTEVWSILDFAFPENEFGNKVVITTHLKSIASLADENHVIKMHGFTDLPNDLQNCILYCGLFPRNYSIGRKWITGLWIAEDFVVDLDYIKTLEEVAEEYLRELIEYSQLKVVKNDIHGNVKQFIVQDYATLSASRVENFGVILHGSNPVELGQNIRRVFIQKCNGPMQVGSTEMLRSFILFDEEAPPLWIVDTLSNFKFLQILCLRFIKTIKVVPDAIYQLCRLRCLDLAFTGVKEIKSSLQKLSLLQTLDLRHTWVELLPKEVVYLQKLQYLYADHPSLRAITVKGDIGKLPFLQTLRKIKFKHNWVTDLKGLTKLRNLFMTEVTQKSVGKLLESLSGMSDLTNLGIAMRTGEVLNMGTTATLRNLEKLHLEGILEERAVPAILDRFGMLKEFCMVMSRLHSDPLPILSKMSSLVNLEMKRAFDGVQLQFCADWFPNLKKLHMGNMPKLSCVVIENGAMRNLQCLRFAILSNLKEAPSGLKYLEKLEDIIIFMMPDEFVGNAQVYLPRVRITRLPQ